MTITAPSRPRRTGAAGLLGLVGPMVVAVGVQSVGNLGFHALAGRWLDADRYGALGTLLAATTALAVPLGALQVAAAGTVAEHGPGRATARRVLGRTAAWSLLGAVALLPLTPVLATWWRLDGWREAALVLPYAAVAALTATARGLLLGDGAPGSVARSYVLGTAARVAVGVVATSTLGVTGALAATVAGEAVSLLVCQRALHPRLRPDLPCARTGVGHVLRPTLAVTGLFLLSTVDLLLARHFLPPTASGAYVAAATIGKTVLALPAAVMSVFYPELVRARATGRLRPALWRALLGVCGSAWIAAGVALVVPQLVLQVLYGDAYASATTLVRVLVLVAAVTSTATVLTQAALARGSRWTWWAWAGAALEVCLVLASHSSSVAVALASAGAVLPTVLVLVATEGRAWFLERLVDDGKRG